MVPGWPCTDPPCVPFKCLFGGRKWAPTLSCNSLVCAVVVRVTCSPRVVVQRVEVAVRPLSTSIGLLQTPLFLCFLCLFILVEVNFILSSIFFIISSFTSLPPVCKVVKQGISCFQSSLLQVVYILTPSSLMPLFSSLLFFLLLFLLSWPLAYEEWGCPSVTTCSIRPVASHGAPSFWSKLYRRDCSEGVEGPWHFIALEVNMRQPYTRAVLQSHSVQPQIACNRIMKATCIVTVRCPQSSSVPEALVVYILISSKLMSL